MLKPKKSGMTTSRSGLSTLKSKYFEHQLHRHQHRIVAAHQPAFGEAAEIIHQRDIELASSVPSAPGAIVPERTVSSVANGTTLPAVGKMRADGAADAAVNACA